MVQLNYTFTTGRRFNSKLIYTLEEKQLYRFNKNINIGSVYLCSSCKCRVKLYENGNLFQEKRYSKHSHGTKENEYTELVIVNKIKEKCSDIKTMINERKQSVRDIFYSVLSEYPGITLNFFKYESTLQKIRNSAIPKNPTSCDEIAKLFDDEQLMNLIGISKDGKPFYNGVVQSIEFCFCVFSSYTSISLFKKHKLETFAVVPIGTFKQLLIIYGVYIEKVSLNSSLKIT